MARGFVYLTAVGGVAEALIATASGLYVAMIGLVFFNGLHNRVRPVVHQLDTLKTALVNRLTSDRHANASGACVTFATRNAQDFFSCLGPIQ
jgi:hypothetical protein